MLQKKNMSVIITSALFACCNTFFASQEILQPLQKEKCAKKNQQQMIILAQDTIGKQNDLIQALKIENFLLRESLKTTARKNTSLLSRLCILTKQLSKKENLLEEKEQRIKHDKEFWNLMLQQIAFHLSMIDSNFQKHEALNKHNKELELIFKQQNNEPTDP